MKKSIVSNLILTGVIATAMTSCDKVKTNTEEVGEADEVREALTEEASATADSLQAKTDEHKCGEGKCGEGKCGEGSCGDH